jgi:hypothetical protein
MLAYTIEGYFDKKECTVAPPPGLRRFGDA